MKNMTRLLHLYSIASTTTLFVLFLSGSAHSGRAGPGEVLTVSRINVVDSTGQVRLIIAGSFPPRRNELAGILFMNNEGGEAGGLVYRGRMKDGKPSAGATLTMDQFHEDQVVALQYDHNGTSKRLGLTIAERPDTMGPELAELYRVLDPMPESPRRDSIAKVLVARLPLDQRASRRVFVGRDSTRAAMVNLADRAGTTRLRIVVDSSGTPSILFMDAAGRVVKTIGVDR